MADAEASGARAQGAEAVLRSVPGRSTVARLDGGEPRVEKRFGGSGRLGVFRARRAARREAGALVALAALGLPVPRVLAHERAPDGARLVLEGLPHERTLREALAEPDAARRRGALAALLELTVALHGAGWVHRDLYLQHVVPVASGRLAGRLALLDLGRARRPRWRRTRWRVKDLAALALWAPAKVSRAERWRFLVRWIERVEGARDARRARRLARRVVAKAARMAAHRPKHGGESPRGWRTGWPGAPAADERAAEGRA